MGASVPKKRKPPMTTTHCCIFWELVCCKFCCKTSFCSFFSARPFVGLSHFGKISCLGSSSSSCALSKVPRASNLLCNSILEGKESFPFLPCSVAFFHLSWPLVKLPFSWHKADPGPVSIVAALSWVLCIRDGRRQLHWPISLWRILEFSSVCHLLLQLGHQTEQVMDLVTLSHRLAWNNFPPPRISLHASPKQKPGWPHAWAAALCVQLHCFCWVLEAQESRGHCLFLGDHGTANNYFPLLGTSPLQNVNACLLQSPGLMGLACLNILHCQWGLCLLWFLLIHGSLFSRE